MKKSNIVKAGLALAAAMVVMTGCGSKENAAATTAAAETVAHETKSAEELTDEASIKLGEYKGLTRTVAKSEVTEDMIQEELEYYAGLYPEEITGRPAELGDVANIDYVGYKDGVAFEGGTADGYDLKLGSHSFIDGFEDGIVGMEIGEERDLNLTFPEQYHSEELAGKDVVFHVTLNGLSSAENTKIDDTLAKKVLGDDNATLEQLKDEVYNDMMLRAESAFYMNGGAEILSQVIANSEITIDPDALEEMIYEMETSYRAQAEMFGFEYEEYLLYFYGMDASQLEAYATEIVKQEMTMKEIVRMEGLEITDAQKDLMAKMNGFVDEADMLAKLGEESCASVFEVAVANFFLLDNSVFVETEE